MPLPVQAALFKKIFGYDEALDADANPKILVVYGEEGAEQASAVVRAFRQVGLEASAAKLSAAGANISSVSAVYAMGSAVAAGLRDLCVNHRVLSISGARALAASGEISVAIGRKQDGKPEIVINLSRSRAENHRFSAALLSLARIIQ